MLINKKTLSVIPEEERSVRLMFLPSETLATSELLMIATCGIVLYNSIASSKSKSSTLIAKIEPCGAFTMNYSILAL